MSAPRVGQIWRRYARIDSPQQDVVTVLHVELNHVVVEYRDRKYENNGEVGLKRDWWPKAWFDAPTMLREW